MAFTFAPESTLDEPRLRAVVVGGISRGVSRLTLAPKARDIIDLIEHWCSPAMVRIRR
jgi:hypothetical protein